VELTGTEFELLLLLAREPGKVFSRDDILNQLRGHEAELYTRAVDIVVSRLRKKLEPLDGIKTLRNAGYSLALRRVPWHEHSHATQVATLVMATGQTPSGALHQAAPGAGVFAAGCGHDVCVHHRGAKSVFAGLA
jgi:DNA-binding winged helix-turn-helix (wHTH) protein